MLHVSMCLPSPCQEIIDSLCSNANSKYILVMVSIGSNNLLTSNLENKADKETKHTTKPKLVSTLRSVAMLGNFT